jgi:hypothetical protein
MDPVTIGTAVVTILAPYAADAGKELVKTAGEVGLEKAKGLMTWLKQQFAGDPVAGTDLSRFEKDPAKFASGLEETIERKASEDPAFSAELTNRVKAVAPNITVVQRIKEGKNVIAVEVGTVGSGTISATQEMDKGEGVTGFKGNTIG